MARTIAVWGPTALATPTLKLMLRSALTTVVETITLTEHATVKRLYTGTVTASAGQYRHNLLSAGAYVGGGSVYVGATDATTYEEDNSLDWQHIVNQGATVGLTATSIPWNAAWDAEVQSECDDAVTANATIVAINAKTTNLPATPAAVGSAMTLTSGERDSIAAALLDLAAGIETGVTPRQALRAISAICAGLVTGAGTGTEVFKGIGQASGGTTRATVTVDSSGNRSAVSLP